MTLLSLTMAVVAGIAAGLAGHGIALRRLEVPRWPPVTVGITAAAAGTIAAGWVRGEPLGPILTLCTQVLLAGVGVAAMTFSIKARTASPKH